MRESEKGTALWDPNRPFRPDRLPFFYGWIIAGLGALGIVASIPGQTIGVNVFSEKLIVALGLSRAEVSFSYMIGTTASGFMLPLAGALYDRLGARRLVVLASIGLGVSLFYMSVVDRLADAFATALGGSGGRYSSLLFLIVGFFLIRFWGQGALTLTSRNMVGKWWEKHRGKVLSISGIAVSVCFSLAPKAFDALIESSDWRTAWRILGLVSILVMSFVGWFAFRDNPIECGLEPDGGRGQNSAQAGNPEFTIARDFTRREALGSYAFWLFSLIFATQACYYTAYTFNVVDVAKDVGLSKDAILNLFVPSAVIGASISLVVGWASDRYRLKRLIQFMAIGMTLPPIGLIVGGEFVMPALIIVGFGVASGCFGTLSGTFIPRFFGLKHLGAISGLFMTMVVIASAIGPFLFSITHSFFGSYKPVHWFTLCFVAALAVGATWANNPQRALLKR